MLDSPLLRLEMTPFSYVVIRMQYYGAPVKAVLQLMVGPPDTGQPPYSVPWTARQALRVVDDSGSLANTSAADAIDGNPYTSWQANSTLGAWLILDLGGDRSVTEIKILTYSNTSPRRCLLQMSVTSGVGPFRTAASFTVQNDSIGFQSFTGMEVGYARYWKLLVLDDYGGPIVQIFEVEIFGMDNSIANIPFSIPNTGEFSVVYIPVFQHTLGGLNRARISLSYPGITSFAHSPSSQFIAIDYIRFMRAPDIRRVRGCLDKYYSNQNLINAQYNVTSSVERINGHLSLYSFNKNDMSLPFATTYDCPLEGGISIIIEGYNFGSSASALISGQTCPITRHYVSSTDGRLETIVCTLPSSASGIAMVEVQNGLHPRINQLLPYLEYRIPASAPEPPIVSNIGSSRVDLSWLPPGNVFAQMTVTGYVVKWRQETSLMTTPNFTMTVGNVTQTSVRNLSPNTSYLFYIAAVSESAYPISAANLPTDLYGRRSLLSGAVIGIFSDAANYTKTLLNDFAFSAFDVNATLNHSAVGNSNSLGPTGNFGGEGSYGLYLLGFANVENCNISTSCCDGYNTSVGTISCNPNISVCSISTSSRFSMTSTDQRPIPSNAAVDGSTPIIRMQSLEDFLALKGSYTPSIACGSAARLTSSGPQQTGAIWYRRKQNVAEGFDTYFTFRISNPSQVCMRMDDVNTFCRSRGADGLAFVIQNSNPYAIGYDGSALGYGGILNGLAIEIDTFYNYDRLDYYENHISVITRVSDTLTVIHA